MDRSGHPGRRVSLALLTNAAPLLLALSILGRLAWTLLVPNAAAVGDLHDFVGAAATIGTSHRLYDYRYISHVAPPLPFAYPPFAAIVFFPLHLLPFEVVAWVWRVGIVAAVYALVRLSQRLLGGSAGGHRTAMLWTSVGIWIEPLRSTFDWGQVSLFLEVAVLYAVCSTRWWVSGALVGLVTGIKLTPAISGLYFLGARRWATAVFAVVVFAGTVAASVLVLGDQARYYFTDLIGDTHRVIGSVGALNNESWRAGLSRILGHDAGYGPPVVVALAVTAVLMLLAWRAVGTSDRLGGILMVELFGLLLSPVSWTHHWVWLLPLMIWLLHGPLRERAGARILGWGWLVLTAPPWLLRLVQSMTPRGSHPWYLAWTGMAYIAATLITLAWVASTSLSDRRRAPTPNSAARLEESTDCSPIR
ncbi:alpha-(1-2)-phosphatidylinositol mannosyltransferase [Mycobacterium kyorinense]|uniref:Alpha-(1-2)-phosphatidylinositol mannosyltransferase n=1 Tax=Mycobacterium kyorinense TaxID=487514 RepID=A0A1A2YW20_9MYCO|nr:mannosyltransferase [Mycobacterium kyorinense]OBI41131.1 alpha-(1-2)-phosphatidylinositol mannosyltransferase [Mycobacterium kyorinense]